MSLRKRIHDWRLLRRIDREFERSSVAQTPDTDAWQAQPLAILTYSEVMSPGEVRAWLGLPVADTPTPDGWVEGRECPIGFALYGLGNTEPLDFLLNDGTLLSQMVDDEIVRQLTVIVRDHPLVQAALDEINGVTEVLEPQP